MTVARPIYFNGKFYAGSMNGVHRVSDRLVREIDSLLSHCKSPFDVRLIAPKNSDWVPKLDNIKVERVGSVGAFWEQIILPFKAIGGVLVNLANISPIMHPRKITMVHDTQFLLPNCGYSAKQRLWYRALIPLICRTSGKTLTVSEYSRDELARSGMADRSRIEVIYNGVDHMTQVQADQTIRSGLGLEDTAYLVMFGSHKPYKNNAIMFEAMRSLEASQLKLVIVGSDRATLENAGLNPSQDTIFAGTVSDPQLKGLLEGALALAFPSFTEGFGLPPLEAMICGCPAIVNAGGAIPESCGDAAVYADGNDPQQWCHAINRLQSDEQFRSDMIARGLEQARAFTWQRAGRSLLREIQSLACGTPKTRKEKISSEAGR